MDVEAVCGVRPGARMVVPCARLRAADADLLPRRGLRATSSHFTSCSFPQSLKSRETQGVAAYARWPQLLHPLEALTAPNTSKLPEPAWRLKNQSSSSLPWRCMLYIPGLLNTGVPSQWSCLPITHARCHITNYSTILTHRPYIHQVSKLYMAAHDSL